MKVKVGDVDVSPGEVDRLDWDHSRTIQGTSSTLVITLVNGTKLRVGGVEAYEVERKLTQGE